MRVDNETTNLQINKMNPFRDCVTKVLSQNCNQSRLNLDYRDPQPFLLYALLALRNASLVFTEPLIRVDQSLLSCTALTHTQVLMTILLEMCTVRTVDHLHSHKLAIVCTITSICRDSTEEYSIFWSSVQSIDQIKFCKER